MSLLLPLWRLPLAPLLLVETLVAGHHLQERLGVLWGVLHWHLTGGTKFVLIVLTDLIVNISCFVQEWEV